MQSNIEIKFLTMEQMANAKDIDWRYENVGVDNLGFADKKKNRIFVRAGLESELTKLLVDHELSHLFELEGTDEDEHGIRHKKKGGFWRIVVPIVTSIVGALVGAPALGLLTGGAIGGTTGAVAGSAAGTALGGVAGSSMVGKPNWGSNLMSGATAGLGSAVGGLTGSKLAGSLAGQAANIGLGSIPSRSSYGGMWETTPSGLGEGAPPLPLTNTQGFGMSGYSAPSGIGSGAQGGGRGIQTLGTGQAGIALGGQQGMNALQPTQGTGTSSGRGMNDIFSQQQMNPMGMSNFGGFMPIGI